MAGKMSLGGVSFGAWETPNEVNFGGKHHAVVQEVIGGARVVDAMGPQPSQISWSGRFRGPDALARAMRIDEMRQSGRQVTLAWLGIVRTVVVIDFTAKTEKAWEVPYSVSCEVVSGEGGGVGSFNSLTALISGDINTAVNLVKGW